MTTQLSTLGCWAQTRNTLVQNLSMTLTILQSAPASDDPDSVYMKAETEETRLLTALRAHAVDGLKQIDDAVAAGPLIAQISDLSQAAKREADRIAAITHTIDDVTGAVNAVVQVVAKFGALVAP